MDSILENQDEAAFPQFVDDPGGFAREVLNFNPWSKQEAIGKALVENQRVSVVSCNGAGKTTWAARILLWFINTRRGAIVLTTAPTWHQVGLLWREVRAAFAESNMKLPGELMQTRLDISPNWYAMGLSTDKEERFQGFHAKGSEPGGDGGLLVIVDEASGVADHIFDAMRGYLTSPNCYVLLIGNGNRAEGSFFDSHQRGSWSRFEIAAHDVPKEIISRDWIEEQRIHYGEDSPQWYVRVLGKFPPTGGDYQLCPLWLLEQSCETVPDQDMGKHMGVDVARSGSDQTVCVVTTDGIVTRTEAWTGSDLMDTTRRVMGLAQEEGIESQNIHVDASGLGAGVVDRMAESEMPVDAVDFGAGPQGDWGELLGRDFKAANRRAELHWVGRMALINGLASVPTKFKDNLWRQLQWTNFQYNERGFLLMEPKEKLRQRYGASPDYADAWFLSLSRVYSQRRVFFV